MIVTEPKLALTAMLYGRIVCETVVVIEEVSRLSVARAGNRKLAISPREERRV